MKTNIDKSILDEIPDEIILATLTFMPFFERKSLSLVSKSWNEVTHSPTFIAHHITFLRPWLTQPNDTRKTQAEWFKELDITNLEHALRHCILSYRHAENFRRFQTSFEYRRDIVERYEASLTTNKAPTKSHGPQHHATPPWQIDSAALESILRDPNLEHEALKELFEPGIGIGSSFALGMFGISLMRYGMRTQNSHATFQGLLCLKKAIQKGYGFFLLESQKRISDISDAIQYLKQNKNNLRYPHQEYQFNDQELSILDQIKLPDPSRPRTSEQLTCAAQFFAPHKKIINHSNQAIVANFKSLDELIDKPSASTAK